jgi:nucleoid DNA-binding protein
MKKVGIVNLLAQRAKITPAKAADELDRVVYNALRKVRSGKSVRLPGFGYLKPGDKAA